MEHLPKTHHIVALPQSPRVTVKIERNTREIYWTDYLHVDVQRHLNGIQGQQERMRVKCSTRFSLCKDIRSKTMVIPRTWIREKWSSFSEDNPQREWDKMAETMMLTFAESGHPVFRATSPLSRGVLKSKGGGKLSIHFCADLETIQTVVRTITSVNQLSLYGAVTEMCEEYESCHERTGGPVVMGQSSSSLVLSVIKTEVPLDCDGESKTIFRNISCIVVIGLTTIVRKARQKEEETRKDTNIVLIRQEQSCTSELFKDIQDAI